MQGLIQFDNKQYIQIDIYNNDINELKVKYNNELNELKSKYENLEKKYNSKLNTSNINKNDIKRIDNTNQINQQVDNNICIDGSCLGNGSEHASAGIGIYFGKNDKRNISKKIVSKNKLTNNIAELIAMRETLLFIDKLSCKSIWNIYSDSKYTIDCITKWAYKWRQKGWKTGLNKPVKNKKIIDNLNQLYERNKKYIIIKHIKAHTDKSDPISTGNKYADILAVDGSSSLEELCIDDFV